MTSGPDSDRCWLAFRYVAGEMTGDEAASFEERLGRDQSAREAVAEAVELAGAVFLATSLARPLPTSGHRGGGRWVLCGLARAAAACLALVVGRLAPPPSRPAPPPTTGAPAEAAEAVALTWS